MTAAACVSLCLTLLAVRAASQNCSRTSVGFLPLPDLGAGYYQEKQGGLYPGGGNTRPPAHDAAGLGLARAIHPLDPGGAPDDRDGKVVLLSIGMSNTTQEFSTFKPMADADPLKNPRLVIVDGAQGGMTARIISDLNSANGQRFWTTVDSRLSAAGATPAQVQVAWLKEADARPTAPFPNDAFALKDELAAIARILRTRFPNIRLTYCSSRIYAGYATTALNPEPFAYQSGFAVKWLIEDQINGSPGLNFDPAQGPVSAPWLAWGPYLWADGLTPRSDGLTYVCSDFNPNDGTHPASPGAREKVARMLLDFFKSDSTAKPWFLRDEKIAASLMFPALVGRKSGVTPNGTVFTGVAVANLDTVEAALTVTAFDESGNRISGPGIENPKPLPRPLGAGQQLPILDFQIFGEGVANQAGWFRVDSSALKTTGFFLIFDDGLSVLDGANASFRGASSFVLPDVTAGSFAEIRVVNPGSEAAEVRFQALDAAGNPRGAATRTIPAGGALIEPLSGLFTTRFTSGDHLRATANQEVLSLLLLGDGGRYITALEGQAIASGASMLYSPQYAVGGGWRSALSVVNLDGQAGKVTFEFAERTGGSITRVQPIAANGKILLEDQNFFVESGAGLREGYVKISSDGVRLAGSVTFGEVQQLSYASTLPLVSKLQNDVVFSHLASDASYYTGVAVLNPGGAEARLSVQVFDREGNLLADVTSTLAARSSRAFALSTLPELRNRNLISGHIRVRADQPIAGFALFGTLNNTALSAIPPQLLP